MTATHIIHRPLRGSRISTFYPIKNLPSLSSLDSAFQLQEYISLLIRLDVHDVDSIVSLPGTSKKDREAAVAQVSKDDDKDGERKNDVQVDQACWIYEQLRRIAQDLSHPLITTLQQECSRATCPEMKAGEWLYLCVAHGNDGAMEQCCAIDYILHTVDSATALLNSPRTFPSRLQIPQTSHRYFASLARRLGRIFAHAYYSHREIFEQAEAESSLYARFLALTSKFDLVPAEFLVIPSNQYIRGIEADPSHDERDHYSPNQSIEHILPEDIIPKVPQHLLRVDGSTSPLLSISSEESPVSNGGIGEHPTVTNGNRPRFGRNRTDTMVFADIEFNGLADELAAKARAGEFDMNYEAEVRKADGLIVTSVPSSLRDHEDLDMGHESETHFETSLNEDTDSDSEPIRVGLSNQLRRRETELFIPDTELESDVFTAGSIDSATMDEHVQATISEDADGPPDPSNDHTDSEHVDHHQEEQQVSSDSEMLTIAPVVEDASSSSHEAEIEDEPVAMEPEPSFDHSSEAIVEGNSDNKGTAISDVHDDERTAS